MEEKNLHTEAIIALVLGIASLVLLLFGWSSLLGLAFGIVAIVLGKKVNNASQGKESLGKAGYICGLIGTIISAIEVVILIIALIFFGSFAKKVVNNGESINNTIEDSFGKITDKIIESQNEEDDIEDDELEETESDDLEDEDDTEDTFKSTYDDVMNMIGGMN